MRVFRSLLPKLLLGAVLLSSLAAHADSDAVEFHELMRSALPASWQDDHSLSRIHELPDSHLMAATQAPTLYEAIQDVNQATLTQLVPMTEQTEASLKLNADQILSKRPVTMVIVPGIFGEFINVRAFEDVFKKSQADQREFADLVQAAKGRGEAEATDAILGFHDLKDQTVPLDQVLNVGSLRSADGEVLVRVVLLYTRKYSLESLGSLQEHASLFIERLQKYLALTGDQDLVLVGYSRGTDTALEMLAQAKEKNQKWLSDVRGMISLGGVNWGSTLADNAAILPAATKLRHDLDQNSFINTSLAWLRFGAALVKNGINPLTAVRDLRGLDPKQLLTKKPAFVSLDAASIAGLVVTGWKEFGLSYPKRDFAINVRRFGRFLESVLYGVNDLTTESRLSWWRQNTLPSSLKYYAIAGAMADPSTDALGKELFYGPYGYSKSFDDALLLMDHRDYQRMSGIEMNDSQVSVAQVMFLPNLEATLNPANANLNSAFLGVLGTHHWGMALPVVNEMADGRLNPFPREALLKALAAKVSLDLQKYPSRFKISL